MMILEMDLIKEPDEIIPDEILDIILQVAKGPYLELSNDDSLIEDSPYTLEENLNRLVEGIYKYEDGYRILLWTGIFLGQCIIPTIELHNPNNHLPSVVLNLVCGYCFNYAAINDVYAKDKIDFLPLQEEIRQRLFVGENNLYVLNQEDITPSYYKNAIKFYYHLLGLCIGSDITYEMCELLKLCIKEDVLSEEKMTRQLILHWVSIEIVCSIWKGKLPNTAYDRINFWHSTNTKLFN